MTAQDKQEMIYHLGMEVYPSYAAGVAAQTIATELVNRGWSNNRDFILGIANILSRHVEKAIEEDRASRRKQLDNEETWAPGDYALQIADGFESVRISKDDISHSKLIKAIAEAMEEYAVEQVEGEREASAQECEDYQKEMESEGSLRQAEIAKNCAALIRARSQSKGE